MKNTGSLAHLASLVRPEEHLLQPGIPGGAADSHSVFGYWHILWRSKGLLIANAMLCSLTALFFTYRQTPVYRARASLESQGLNERFLNLTDLDPIATAANAASDSEIQTQIEVLQSSALLRRVCSQLKLEQRPEFQYKPGRFAAWSKGIGLSSPAPASPRDYVLAVAAASLKVSAVRGSRIIKIVYDSTDPRLAANFANMLAQDFIDQHLESHVKSAQHTGEWLAQQLENLKVKLQRSEDDLQSYARNSGLLFTAEKDSVGEQELKQIQEELSRAQAERIARQSQYEMAQLNRPDSLPEVLDSSSLREYRGRLTNLRLQLADLRTMFTPTHHKVKQVEAQIAELETAVARERANVLNRIANEYDSARRREQLLLSAYKSQAALVSEQDAKAIHYKMLKREVDTNRQLYYAMLQKVKEAGMASALRASSIVIVDPAEVPTDPYKPNPMLNSALGLVTGVFLGAVFVFTRAGADRSLKGPRDTALYLNLPELGVIPSASGGSMLGRAARKYLPEKSGNSGRICRTDGPLELVTWYRPPSPVAEAFRATLVSILSSGENGRGPRVIVLTSPSPREGKTTAIANLGIALSRIEHRVLLVDADMCKPRLHLVFSLPNALGLSDFLRGADSLEEYPPKRLAQATELPGLYVLTSGSSFPTPSYLLHSRRLTELLRRCRQDFDTVLIDTPPVLQVADARVLGRLADAVVLICRAGETHRDSALAAVQRFTADRIPVMGVILNDWDRNDSSPQYYYR